MPLASYEIAINYNQSGSVVNIETVVPKPPRSLRVSLGSVSRITMGGKQDTSGNIMVVWIWDALNQTQLDALITYIWGDWTTQNKKVTIGTRLTDDTYGYYNAIAHLPRVNIDYQLQIGHIRPAVNVNFFIDGVAT